jgi:hypothetical protein
MTISPARAHTADRGWPLLATPPDWLLDEGDTETDTPGAPRRDTATVPADLAARQGTGAVPDQPTTELRRRDGYATPTERDRRAILRHRYAAARGVA